MGCDRWKPKRPFPKQPRAVVELCVLITDQDVEEIIRASRTGGGSSTKYDFARSETIDPKQMSGGFVWQPYDRAAIPSALYFWIDGALRKFPHTHLGLTECIG